MLVLNRQLQKTSKGLFASPHLHRSTHWLMARSLYAAVNGPRYAMQPADSSTSPVRCV